MQHVNHLPNTVISKFFSSAGTVCVTPQRHVPLSVHAMFLSRTAVFEPFSKVNVASRLKLPSSLSLSKKTDLGGGTASTVHRN